MAQGLEQPEISAVTKYGPCDVQRYDNLFQASVGQKQIGKVHVDCKFLFKKAKWGTLDNHKAGIIYLDLTFSQPSGYCLQSATIQVTLDDQDGYLAREFPNRNKKATLQIREYGPREIIGSPRFETVETHNEVMPEVEVGSIVGAGGVGHKSVKKTVRDFWWKFEGHKKTGDLAEAGARAGAYKVLQWNITENELQPQPLHNNTVC